MEVAGNRHETSEHSPPAGNVVLAPTLKKRVDRILDWLRLGLASADALHPIHHSLNKAADRSRHSATVHGATALFRPMSTRAPLGRGAGLLGPHSFFHQHPYESQW